MRLPPIIKSVLLRAVSVALPIALASAALAQTPATEPPRQSRFGPPWPDDTTPVRVNVPRDYDVMASFAPSAEKPSSGTFFVEYPSMRPWPFGSKPCRRLCEGQVAVEISTGEVSSMNREAWAFLRGLRPAQGQVGPPTSARYSITEVAPPTDYTQSWTKVDNAPTEMFPLPIEMAILLRAEADGRPREYVECATRMPPFQGEPSCQVYTTLDGNPAVHIGVRFLTRHWPDRAAIRAAVMQLVKSWL